MVKALLGNGDVGLHLLTVKLGPGSCLFSLISKETMTAVTLLCVWLTVSISSPLASLRQFQPSLVCT